MNSYNLQYSAGRYFVKYNSLSNEVEIDLTSLERSEPITLNKEQALKLIDFILLAYDITIHAPNYDYKSIKMPKDKVEEQISEAI